MNDIQHTKPTNGFGVAGFVCSLLGFCVPVLPIVGVILSAIGLRKEPKGLAIAGLVIGLVLILIQVIGAVLYLGFILAALGLVVALSGPVVTAAQVSAVAAAAETYQSDQGEPPADISTLVEAGYILEEDTTDYFGNELVIEITDTGEIVVVSPGEDGILGNDDDIRSDQDNSAGDSSTTFGGLSTEEMQDIINRAAEAGNRIQEEQQSGNN